MTTDIFGQSVNGHRRPEGQWFIIDTGTVSIVDHDRDITCCPDNCRNVLNFEGQRAGAFTEDALRIRPDQGLQTHLVYMRIKIGRLNAKFFQVLVTKGAGGVIGAVRDQQMPALLNNTQNGQRAGG